MDAQLKAKWIEALRSGEYRQAQGSLHDQDNGGYCCLGVLCKVMGAEFGSVGDDADQSYDYVPHIGRRVLSAGEDEELGADVLGEIGIPDQKPLIQMNDGNTDLGIAQHSFSEIADYIEKNL
jgi:hypothetical protein